MSICRLFSLAVIAVDTVGLSSGCHQRIVGLVIAPPGVGGVISDEWETPVSSSRSIGAQVLHEIAAALSVPRNRPGALLGRWPGCRLHGRLPRHAEADIFTLDRSIGMGSSSSGTDRSSLVAAAAVDSLNGKARIARESSFPTSTSPRSSLP